MTEVRERKRDRKKEEGPMKRRHIFVFCFYSYNKMAWFLYTGPNQTLPYRLLYIVQPGVFTHDCSMLLTVPPPPRQIYTRRPCWGGERKERVKVYYKTLFINYSFHLDYILDLENENRPPFWQIVLHFKPECSTVHHKLLYFYLTIGWLLNVIQYIYISH